MKTKLLCIDLAICSLWMLSALSGRNGWDEPFFVISVLGVLVRLVVSFSLYYQEKRSWLPLGIFALLTGLMVFGGDVSIGTIASYFFYLSGLENVSVIKDILAISLFLWIFVLPYLYMISLVGKLRRTELTWKELLGGILWHDRLTKTCSAILAVMFLAFLTGMSMAPHLCQTVCFTAVPITYWLLCHYHQVKSDFLWLLIVSMAVFWYGQQYAGAWRASLLFISFALVVYVCTRLRKNTQSCLLAISSVLYLGILLPSFSIGYNQYACISYARKGFYYLNPFKGILYITDSTGELFGLRDRYGLLVEPTYEHITNGKFSSSNWAYEYAMQKDGYSRYYDVLNNVFVKEPDIKADLQHSVRKVIEGYFAKLGSDYDDRGQIKVTDLKKGKVIADIRIGMYGLPSLFYNPERFISDDSVEVAAGEFFRNDSVVVYNDMLKKSMSYAVNALDSDSCSRYRIYVRLATEKVPSHYTLIDIARDVASLPELNQ